MVFYSVVKKSSKILLFVFLPEGLHKILFCDSFRSTLIIDYEKTGSFSSTAGLVEAIGSTRFSIFQKIKMKYLSGRNFFNTVAPVKCA